MERRLPPNSGQHEASSVQATIDALAARVDAFEEHLKQAMASEQTFRNNLQTVTRALDSFVENHRQADMNLTRMIQEDTQRSREAREEYDVLAARLNDSIRPHRSTRHFQVLKTVSLYISIVLSVVFMAPIHAVVWIFESLLNRLGYRKQVSAYGGDSVYGDSSARQHVRQSGRRTPKAAHSSSSTRDQIQSNAGCKAMEADSKSLASQKPPASSSGKNSGVRAGARDENVIRKVPPDVTNVLSLADDLKKNGGVPGTAQETPDWTKGSVHGASLSQKGRPSVRQTENDSSSADSDDVFVDASAGKGGEEIESQKDVETESDENASVDDNDSDGGAPEDESGRPDWARPEDSDQALPELSTFPSSEFWNISEDEIRLEFLKRDSGASSPNPGHVGT